LRALADLGVADSLVGAPVKYRIWRADETIGNAEIR
jgi:serine protease inhibitor ecotin